MVVTAPASKISWRMSSRLVAQAVLLLRSWPMELWWPGAVEKMVVTAPESEIIFKMFSRSVAQNMLLLRFWQMEAWCFVGPRTLWWWQLQSPRSAEERAADLWHRARFCCHFGRWKRSDLGPSRRWWGELQSPRWVQECSADLCHRQCFCCDLGRWNCGYLGQSRKWWWQLQSPTRLLVHVDSIQTHLRAKVVVLAVDLHLISPPDWQWTLDQLRGLK